MSDVIRPAADAPEEPPEPPRLRALRRLVTLLTMVLIVGVVTIAAALVLRLAREPAAPTFDPRAVSAERVTLPPGEALTAVGAAGGALILATRDGDGRERLRLYDAEAGEAIREIAIERGE